MALSVVIFGAGRVGQALGQRLHAAGVDLLGYVGRDPARTAAAIAWVGDGKVPVVPAHTHAQAHVVLFAVGDGDLPAAVRSAAAQHAPRPCSLWLHTSGRHGLEVFDGVPGIRRGILHPAAPFADGRSASASIAGAPAVVVGDTNARTLLQGLCRRLGMQPVLGQPGDRSLYHAACALAANGMTALWAAAQAAMSASGVLDAAAAAKVVAALVAAADRSCQERGPAAALSGPVRRGDAATVLAHVQALQQHAPASAAAYRSLSVLALALAQQAGLAAGDVAALARALGVSPPT